MLSALLLLAQTEDRFNKPSYFVIVSFGLLVLGALGWLVAAVLGFARANAFGPAIRWFALAAVCMLIYHLQFGIVAIGVVINDPDLVLGAGAFFNLFVVLASVCAIFGFTKLTSTR
jgi:uncharacterized membrane protein YhdT